MNSKQSILNEFQTLSGVGKATAQDLWDLDFRSLDELKNQDPQELYDRLCQLQATQLDRCVLYVFRCIVYQVNTNVPNKKLLLWWNWKQ